LRFGTRRTHPIRKKPGGGPDRIVATSHEKSLSVERSSSPFSKAAPQAGQDEPGSSEIVVLAQGEVRGEIAGSPRLQESWCLGTEFIEQVAELCSFNSVEKHNGHVDGV